MKDLKIWVIARDKEPFSPKTWHRTGVTQKYSADWTTYDVAKASLDEAFAEMQKRMDAAIKSGDAEKIEKAKAMIKRQRILGFVVPEGYFFLDVDHKGTDDPLVKEMLKLFPTYAELSPSGNGVHFYGKCDISQLPTEEINGKAKLASKYYIRNAGLELYIGGLTDRFSTYTGNRISETEEYADCTKELVIFLDRYMVKATSTIPDNPDSLNTHNNSKEENSGEKGEKGRVGVRGAEDISALIPIEERYLRLEEKDIPDIIDDLRQFKNNGKFSELYDEGKVEKTPSEADVALCALIAFRVGPASPEIIDKIFRSSALYRDKWEREDYAARTIKAGIEACHGVFYNEVKIKPPFVIESKNGKESINTMALQLYVSERLKYLLVRDEKQSSSRIYVYMNGHYAYCADDTFEGIVKKIVSLYDPLLIRPNTLTDVSKLIRKSDVTFLPDDLDSNKEYINIKEGLLSMKTLEVIPHSPKFYSTIQIPVLWREEPTPVFDRFMNDLSSGDQDIIRFLLEYIGACCSNVPGYEFKKALFLVGAGDTGKSQLKRLVEMLLGKGNYASVDLKQLEARFGTSHLYGKRLAGSSDMGFMKVPELKKFKEITGGDSIFAEHKGVDGFYFTYKGFLWFCTNEMPKFGGDKGKWVYERIIIIPCHNVIPKEKQDSEILSKMYAERNGIFHKAIMAFQDVLKDGKKFHEPACSAEMREKYEIENSSSIEFFTTMMEPRKEMKVPKDDPSTVETIYRIFLSWYENMHYDKSYIPSKKEFFDDIASFIGVPYELMKKRKNSGFSLKGYALTKEALEKFHYTVY